MKFLHRHSNVKRFGNIAMHYAVAQQIMQNPLSFIKGNRYAFPPLIRQRKTKPTDLTD